MNTASILDTTPALDTNKLFHHFGSIYKDSESDFTLCVPAWVKALKESREQRFAYDERINRVISRLHDIARTVEDESKILTGISRQTDDLTVKAMKNEERWNMYFLAKDDAYEALQVGHCPRINHPFENPGVGTSDMGYKVELVP